MCCVARTAVVLSQSGILVQDFDPDFVDMNYHVYRNEIHDPNFDDLNYDDERNEIHDDVGTDDDSCE